MHCMRRFAVGPIYGASCTGCMVLTKGLLVGIGYHCHTRQDGWYNGFDFFETPLDSLVCSRTSNIK